MHKHCIDSSYALRIMSEVLHRSVNTVRHHAGGVGLGLGGVEIKTVAKTTKCQIFASSIG
jgi:hypothetical protein